MKLKFLFLPLLLTIFSCTVKLNPAKSDDVKSRLDQIQKGVNKIYEGPGNYSDVQPLFATLQPEVAELLVINKARSKAASVTTATELLQKLLLKDEAEYKSYNHISNPMAQIYLSQITEQINNIYYYENHLK